MPKLPSALTKINVQLFPNPVHDQLQVHYQTPQPQTTVTLQVINSTGQVVQQRMVSEQAEAVYTLSVANLPAGFYGLQVWRQQETLAALSFIKF